MSTSKSNLAGAAALVVGPLLALIFAIVAPTVSDDAGDRVAALGDHRSTVLFPSFHRSQCPAGSFRTSRKIARGAGT